MDVSEFTYDLPSGLIAQRPPPERDGSRLMVLGPDGIAHRRFPDVVRYLGAGDIIVLNDSRVIPARLRGLKPTGGRVEVLLLRKGGADVADASNAMAGGGGTVGEGACGDGVVKTSAHAPPSAMEGGVWECLISGRRIRPGTRISLVRRGEDGPAPDAPGVEVMDHLEADRYRVVLLPAGDDGGVGPLPEGYGEMPTPPYIRETLEEPGRYQTVYSREEGSAAAPTAGLHFTPVLLDALRDKGVNVRRVTLHVGLSTFAPVRTERVEDHRIGTEWFEVPRETAEAVNDARDAGRRVMYVGTTTARAMESAALQDGTIAPARREADIFIYPGYRFRAPPDLLLTNFHLPGSTLIMLVSALAGRDRILGAYSTAVREGYRFYSFGDAMLIIGRGPKDGVRPGGREDP